MRALVLEGKTNPIVRSAAVGVLRESRARPTDDLAEARALHNFVANRVRYTRDVEGVETLQAPWITLAESAGDCDDKATLLAALLKASGNRARLSFRAIGTDSRNPGQFRHVYLVGMFPGVGRFPLDATRSGTLAGWEFPKPTVALEVPL
jgi:transglutaminase-like putative cysteine protease